MKKKENDIFVNLIKGVTPIKKNNKLKRDIPEINNNLLFQKRTNNKLSLSEKTNIPKFLNISKFEIETNKTNKKLKKGKIPIDKKIDFHGLSLLDAENLFTHTINSCYKKKLRCILFITGKGILKKNTNDWNGPKLYYGKIRSNFLIWTKKKELSKFILNVEQASIKYGADGAFFVYLRKKKLNFS